MGFPIGDSPNVVWNIHLPPEQQSQVLRNELAAEKLAWVLGKSGIEPICLWTNCLSGSPYESILRRALVLAGSIRRPTPESDDATVRLRNHHLTMSLQKMTSLDPNKAMTMPHLRVLTHVYESLLRPPLGDGPPRPGLATHFDVSKDGLIYTFHLRQGLQWSDGVPLSAQDVVYGWQRALSPQTASQATDMFQHVKNARAFSASRLTDFAEVGIKAPNDHTVVITLENPLPSFPSLVVLAPFAPIPRHAPEKWGTVTSGPFTVESANLDHQLVLRRNPRYWNNTHNEFDTLTIYLTENNRTAFDWYKVGKVDWVVENLPPDLVQEAIDHQLPGLFTAPTEVVELLIFNMKREPFSDKALRQSVAAALDRDDFAMHLTQNTRRPATSIVPDSFSKTGYHGAAWPQMNSGVAQMGRMAALGKSLEIYFYTDDYNRLLAEAVQQQLQKNMGVAQVRVTNMERGTLMSRLMANEFSATLFTNFPDYSDPSYYLNCFRTGNMYNAGQYSNPKYDALMAKVDRTAGLAARNTLMQEAEAVLASDIPILPLFFVEYNALVRPSLKGFVAGANLLYRADDLKLANPP